MIDSFYLRGSVRDDLAKTGSSGFLAHKSTHTLLELLEYFLSFLEPTLEDREGTEHEILLSQDFIHLICDILAEHFN